MILVLNMLMMQMYGFACRRKWNIVQKHGNMYDLTV